MAMKDTSDTFSVASAELSGLRVNDLPGRSDSGQDVLSDYTSFLEDKGFSVRRSSRAQNPERHIVIYSDASGIPQAVLSDDPAADRVNKIGELFISKSSSASTESAGPKQTA